MYLCIQELLLDMMAQVRKPSPQEAETIGPSSRQDLVSKRNKQKTKSVGHGGRPFNSSTWNAEAGGSLKS